MSFPYPSQERHNCYYTAIIVFHLLSNHTILSNNQQQNQTTDHLVQGQTNGTPEIKENQPSNY